MRLHFSSTLALILLTTQVRAGDGSQSRKPNIVIILCDDLGTAM